ncbi:MAG TPA: DoxX family protein [Edaphobacter sp.]|nr:DoxX family protein [Edaphobacter sp.]
MFRSLDNLQPWGAFFLRLVLGAAMIYHGWDKVIPHGGFHGGNTFSALERHSHFVASLGMPYWLGIVSALTEFLGGVLILLGFFTRFAAFLISINMLVAIVTVNRHHGYAGSEYSLALMVISLMILFYGAGVCALDRKMGFA